MAAKEVHSINNNNIRIKSAGVSSYCRWNSRGCQAKRVVAVVAQKTGKIVGIVYKNNLL